MMGVRIHLANLPIIKNIAPMNVVEKQQIERSEINTMSKKSGWLERKENALLSHVKIY
jgi:hypothetical protein